MAMAYDDRLIRMSLDRIAHALEAIARSKDPAFKTLAETKTLAAAEAAKSKQDEAGAGTAAQSVRGSKRTGEPWIRPRGKFLDKK